MNSKKLGDITTALGFQELNEMQKAMVACPSNNIVLLSPTGTGKTVAYLLPMLLAEGGVLIISPSRELSLQIDGVIRSTKSGDNSTCCYGGHPYTAEERSLRYSPRFIVGTAGRLLDHLKRGNIDTKNITNLVFDEFDKLLEYGFETEMQEIVSLLPNVKRRTLTSATVAEEIPDYVGMKDATTIDFLSGSTPPAMSYHKVTVGDKGRKESLLELLCNLSPKPTIIFCTFREAAYEVSDFLYDNEISNEVFHGGMEQYDREHALSKFRNGSANILVSTDLAARGLDIPAISHIIHYQLPKSEDAFIHRNGRTARMNASGSIFVMAHPDDRLPEYTDKINDTFVTDPTLPIPIEPYWQTLLVNRGRKDKINKIDILGILCQVGELRKDEVGSIEVKDKRAYVAVPREKIRDVAFRLRGVKIKRIATLITVAR